MAVAYFSLFTIHFSLVLTVQSYGELKNPPRRIDNSEIITNFAPPNR